MCSSDLLKSLGSFRTVTKANISGVASTTISANILQTSFGFLGNSISGLLKGIPNLLKGKNKEEKDLDENLNDIEITEELPGAIEDFLNGLEEQLDLKNKNCLELLNLERWSTNQFIEKIEKGKLE